MLSISDHRDQHDDRGNPNKNSEIRRRVSFKNVRNPKVVNDMKIRAFLEDEDMVQPGESSNQRLSGEYRRGGGANIRNRRKGSPIPRHVGGGGKLMQNQNGWYMITIQHGAKYDKDTLFKLLLNAVSPSVFIPNYYRIEPDSNGASFYVDEHEIAEKIMRLDRKIELPDGFKMIIRVRGSVPQTKIDETLKQRMKAAMGKRYNAATNALDLSKFHADPELSDVFCALFRPPIMSAAIDIIAENIPNLEALNLNDNKLNLLDHLKIITTKLPNIKILYLGNNRVSERKTYYIVIKSLTFRFQIFMLNSLDAFRGLPLVELFLDGNPCKKRARDHSLYVRYQSFSITSQGVT
jgi:nuclear RNA export factor